MKIMHVNINFHNTYEFFSPFLVCPAASRTIYILYIDIVYTDIYNHHRWMSLKPYKG